MRILVTGALGYVGHAVTRELLDAGYEPIALTSRQGARSSINGVTTVHADIRDAARLADVVREVSPEAVCHLAGLTRVRDSIEAPLTYFDVNVGGTIALLHALDPHGCVPIVFTSTGAVYGNCDGRIDEDQPTRPTNPYGASKRAAEEVLGFYAATGAAAVVVLRCFNVAGASAGIGDGDQSRIIPKALAVAAGQADCLGINGDGTAIREFTHVKDVATAVVAALRSAQPGQHRVYNVGSGIGSTMLDVLTTAEAVTGRSIAVEYRPSKQEPTVVMADSTRLRDDLGWLPMHSALEEIVRDAWMVLRR